MFLDPIHFLNLVGVDLGQSESVEALTAKIGAVASVQKATPRSVVKGTNGARYCSSTLIPSVICRGTRSNISRSR
jgi:hypothetical protein